MDHINSLPDTTSDTQCSIKNLNPSKKAEYSQHSTSKLIALLMKNRIRKGATMLLPTTYNQKDLPPPFRRTHQNIGLIYRQKPTLAGLDTRRCTLMAFSSSNHRLKLRTWGLTPGSNKNSKYRIEALQVLQSHHLLQSALKPEQLLPKLGVKKKELTCTITNFIMFDSKGNQVPTLPLTTKFPQATTQRNLFSSIQ